MYYKNIFICFFSTLALLIWHLFLIYVLYLESKVEYYSLDVDRKMCIRLYKMSTLVFFEVEVHCKKNEEILLHLFTAVICVTSNATSCVFIHPSCGLMPWTWTATRLKTPSICTSLSSTWTTTDQSLKTRSTMALWMKAPNQVRKHRRMHEPSKLKR